MTVTISIGNRYLYFSNTPPATGTDFRESDRSLVARLNTEPQAVHHLRRLLAQEMGALAARLANPLVIAEVWKRIEMRRWSLTIVEMAAMPGGILIPGAEAGQSAATAPKSTDPEKTLKKTWVEIALLDHLKRPVKGVRVEVTLPDGTVASGTLGEAGNFRKDGIDPGTCKVRFPDIDGREWSKSSAFAEGKAVELFQGAPKIGAGPYTVKQGDHISSIAHDSGFVSWKTIWEDGSNSSLKQKRNPNVLYPGDVVNVPEKQKKEESVPTTDYHNFQTIGEPLQLKIVVLDWAGNPVVDTDVNIELSSAESQKTGGDGSVKKNIHPGADRTGKLLVKGYELGLKVGHLDPVEELSGQVWRLNNLGYRAGDPKDKQDPDFLSAVEEFQCDHSLTVDGICGPNTQSKLKEVHGS
jgi:LysM repeat protein